MKAAQSALLIAFLAFVLFAPSAAAAGPEAWVGHATEQDDYVAANPMYNVRTSCTSTAGVAVLVHAEGAWRFQAENDCLGYDVRFNDDQCETDVDDVLNCYYADSLGSQHWLTFEPDGDIVVEYLSNSAFAGDHYVIEGNLNHV